MYKNSARGFTLIELLVVIAIIGILASVVLASLNSARDKSRDAAIKSNLVTVRTQAAMSYAASGIYGPSTGSNYSGDCLTSSTIFRMTSGTGEQRDIANNIAAAIAAAVSASGGTTPNCRTDGPRQQYMVAVRLRTSNNYWCVDSTGASEEITALPASGTFSCS